MARSRFDLQRRSSLMATHPPPGGEVIAMAYDKANRLIVVSSSTDTVVMSQLTATGWHQEWDLLALSKGAAGSHAIEPEPAKADTDGFVPIPENAIARAAFSAEAQRIVWVTRNGAVLWAQVLQSGSPKVIRARGGPLEALALSDSGRYVFIAEEGRGVTRFDAEAQAAPPLRYAPPGKVRQMVAAKAETGLFLALDDDTVRHVDFAADPPSETSRTTLHGAAGELIRLAGEDTLLAGGAGSSAGTDVALVKGNAVQRLHARRLGGAASGMAWSKAAGIIAVGDFDGRIHVWDFATNIPMASLQIADGTLNAVAISPNGKQLAVAAGSSGDVFELAMERDRWRRKACDVVRRELTSTEWTALVPATALKAGCESSDVQ